MRISPKYDVAGGLGDFWNEIRRPQPYRWPILLASCAFPAFFLYFFAQERVYAPPETPDIVYIKMRMDEIKSKVFGNSDLIFIFSSYPLSPLTTLPSSPFCALIAILVTQAIAPTCLNSLTRQTF